MYWRRGEFAAKQWTAFVSQCRKIVDQTGVELINDMNAPRPGAKGSSPRVTDKAVCFNGVGEYSHETFYIPRAGSKGDFDFCKTARKPYTAPAAACAMAARHHLNFEVSCDGWDEELGAGAKLFLKTLDEPATKRRGWKALVKRYLGETPE
jgi:hypothetical protein